MIIISEHGKAIVHIESWEDLFTRPGFQEKVDPKKVELKEIIGWYRLPPLKHPCGLTTCREPHFTGYVVQLAGGCETNMGHICGEGRFGDRFTALVKSFRRAFNAQRSREIIEAAQHRVQPVREAVRAMKQGEWGADEAYRKMHRQIAKLFDPGTKLKLSNRAKQMSTAVVRATPRTKKEIKEARIMGDHSEFKEELLFHISGIAAVTDYSKLRTIVNVQLGSELDAFAALQVEGLPFPELRRWSNWANQIDKRHRKARSILEDCHRFLQPDNLAQIRDHKRLL